MNPVTPDRIITAMDFGLRNVAPLAEACREAEVPFFVACALIEKESMGNNIFGNDQGGTFESLPFGWPVTKAGYEIFEYYVVNLGHQSNGVGPAQLTYRGFFTDMRKKGLAPWNPHDNMLYGLQLLHLYKAKTGATWEDAGTAYNGARPYGLDFARKVREWKSRLGIE